MQLEILQHGKRRITQLELLLRSAHQVFPRLDDQQMNAFSRLVTLKATGCSPWILTIRSGRQSLRRF